MQNLFQETIFVCPACGERLQKARANKKFHNNACRARYFRMQRDIRAKANQAQVVIADLDVLLDDPKSAQTAYDLINEIRDSLANVYHSRAYLELSRQNHEKVPYER